MLWWCSGNCSSLHWLIGCWRWIHPEFLSPFFFWASTHSKLFYRVKKAKESPISWATEARQMSFANESKSSLELCSKAYIFNTRMALVICKNILVLLEGSVIFEVGLWFGKLGDFQSETELVSSYYVIRWITLWCDKRVVHPKTKQKKVQRDFFFSFYSTSCYSKHVRLSYILWKNKMRLVIYALYMAVEINLHSLFFWSFIQKIDKILTFPWSKTTESEGGNLIMKYMFFSSCSSWQWHIFVLILMFVCRSLSWWKIQSRSIYF